MRIRFASIPVLAALTALTVAGCGGGSSSGTDPASVAPPKAPFYLEATIQPEGELGENVKTLVKNVAGVEDVGQLIVSELEKSALAAGREVNFEKEVEPWLGEKAGLFLEGYDGHEFRQAGAAVQTSDAGEAEEFVAKAVGSAGSGGSGNFEGIEYAVGPEGDAFGVVGDLLVFTKSQAGFRAAVEAANGESLADRERFQEAMGNAVSGSLATAYVDVGGLIEQAGQEGINPETQLVLESAGIEPKNATAVASVIPGSEQVEVDLSSNISSSKVPVGDASQLLGSLPGGSLAAFASTEFGARLGESVDKIDAKGIPGEIEPHELKQALGAVGIDLDKLTASLGDAGIFAQGNTERNLTGALVIETKSSSEATKAVANIGALLRASGTPGVTAISGKASGFSVHSSGLGRQPLVVATEGSRLAISYGLAASAQALTAEGGATLATNPTYEEAKKALGSTPIGGFVNGPAALALVRNLIPADELAGFEAARPLLSKISFAAIGSGSSGEQTTAKMIVGFTK